jgi:inorganic triphosphatase YgiF
MHTATQANKRYQRETRPSVKKFSTDNLDALPKKGMKELSQNFSSQRKTLKLQSPRFTGNMESSKLKGDHSPNNNKTSVVSGLSIISQLSFIKNSFSSPNIQGEANKANSQKSFEQVTLM